MRHLLACALALAAVSPAFGSRDFAAGNQISMGSPAELDLHGNQTMCAWISLTTYAGPYRIYQHGDIVTTPFIELALLITSAEKLSLEIQNITPSAVSTTTFSTAAWTHVCGRWDGSTSKVYINGIEEHSVAAVTTITHQATNPTIGYSPPFTQTFPGRIAEVAVWSEAIDARQIESIADGFSPAQVSLNNLVSYWPLYGNASPEPDIISSLNGTVTGAAKGDHPRVYR
jgi:hypothetical protein